LDYIEASPNPQFEPAQRIVSRLRERQLYDQVGMPLTKRDPTLTKDDLVQEILRECRRGTSALAVEPAATSEPSLSSSSSSSSSLRDSDSDPSCSQSQPAPTQLSQTRSVLAGPPLRPIQRSDLVVYEMTISYGKDCETGKPGYPLQHVYFFNPKDPEKPPFRIPEQRIGDLNLPRSWEEVKFWVYVRDPQLRATVDAAWTVVRSRLMREAKGMEGGVVQNSPAKLHPSPVSTPSASRRASRGAPASAPSYLAHNSDGGGNGFVRRVVPLELPLGPISELSPAHRD
jgi:hypothetical protein